MDNGWGYLASIIGVDLGVEAGQFEVLYVFCAGAAVLTLAVKIPRATAVIPSVCGIIPSASFFERELSEMFGITITTPNPDRLFLPEEWPHNAYPLRKDFEARLWNRRRVMTCSKRPRTKISSAHRPAAPRAQRAGPL